MALCAAVQRLGARPLPQAAARGSRLEPGLAEPARAGLRPEADSKIKESAKAEESAAQVPAARYHTASHARDPSSGWGVPHISWEPQPSQLAPQSQHAGTRAQPILSETLSTQDSSDSLSYPEIAADHAMLGTITSRANLTRPPPSTASSPRPPRRLARRARRTFSGDDKDLSNSFAHDSLACLAAACLSLPPDGAEEEARAGQGRRGGGRGANRAPGPILPPLKLPVKSDAGLWTRRSNTPKRPHPQSVPGGGSGAHKAGALQAVSSPWSQHPQANSLRLPPPSPRAESGTPLAPPGLPPLKKARSSAGPASSPMGAWEERAARPCSAAPSPETLGEFRAPLTPPPPVASLAPAQSSFSEILARLPVRARLRPQLVLSRAQLSLALADETYSHLLVSLEVLREALDAGGGEAPGARPGTSARPSKPPPRLPTAFAQHTHRSRDGQSASAAGGRMASPSMIWQGAHWQGRLLQPVEGGLELGYSAAPPTPLARSSSRTSMMPLEGRSFKKPASSRSQSSLDFIRCISSRGQAFVRLAEAPEEWELPRALRAGELEARPMLSARSSSPTRAEVVKLSAPPPPAQTQEAHRYTSSVEGTRNAPPAALPCQTQAPSRAGDLETPSLTQAGIPPALMTTLLNSLAAGSPHGTRGRAGGAGAELGSLDAERSEGGGVEERRLARASAPPRDKEATLELAMALIKLLRTHAGEGGALAGG